MGIQHLTSITKQPQPTNQHEVPADRSYDGHRGFCRTSPTTSSSTEPPTATSWTHKEHCRARHSNVSLFVNRFVYLIPTTPTFILNNCFSPSLSTLLAAVKAAGLVDTLAGPGPFTVFAPSDNAFAQIPSATLNVSVMS